MKEYQFALIMASVSRITALLSKTETLQTINNFFCILFVVLAVIHFAVYIATSNKK